jgi:hypothetical protein
MNNILKDFLTYNSVVIRSGKVEKSSVHGWEGPLCFQLTILIEGDETWRKPIWQLQS